ncbi:hypothetical protein CYY_002840 [Polysphondylium violaceum]|uniref:D-aminoacyl-tRNA deacylase n=1 Tax=Polysphondylium violaceum TaxID=133409 RepID=A0A8J4V991_9MYCE|nr:hypothetical protein CYY_002840 [Polysphondylium violaceum]
MKAILQRVKSGSVRVDGETISKIGPGLVCLIGIGRDDTKKDMEWMAKKIQNIRLWKNENGDKNWDQNVVQKGYEILFVSQFTLMLTLKGNKPDFHLSMEPEKAKAFYHEFLEMSKKLYSSDKIQDGRFGAMMDVELVNDGPVTIQFDTQKDN